LTDRLPAGDTSRAVTLYTSSFSFGVGFSFLIAQLAADYWGWRSAFFITGVGPIAMVIASLLMEERRPVKRAGPLLDFKPVFANREALGYILGYGAHCFELYGVRTWLVGFWLFVVGHQDGPSWLTPVAVSFAFAVISMPASILGNEAALRFGRHRAITIVMIASACTALMLGLNASGPAWLLAIMLFFYGLTVPADSGALTAGMAASATAGHRGATMALHSTVGFGLSAAGAWGGPGLHSTLGEVPSRLAAGFWRLSCWRSGSRWGRSRSGGHGPQRLGAYRLSRRREKLHISADQRPYCISCFAEL